MSLAPVRKKSGTPDSGAYSSPGGPASSCTTSPNRSQAQPPDGGGRRGEGGAERRGGERSEPPRSAATPSPRLEEGGHTDDPPAPNPEVPEKPARRRFTAEYKRRILDEADACTEPGQIGALLRREGLYSSHLRNWRLQREKALTQALAPRRRGRRPTRNPLADELARIQRENARLRQRIEQAELIIEIQKKTSQLLGLPPVDVPDLDANDGSNRNKA